MPSRYGKENTYQMEPMNTGHHESEAQTHYKYDLGYSPDIPHAKQHTRNSKPSHLDIPRTSISYDESKPNYIEPNVSRLRQLKTNTFNFLEGKKTYRSKMWHRFVVVLIVISICLAVSATLKNLDKPKKKRLQDALLAFELILFLIFAAEYTLRIWSCSANSSYLNWRGTILFITRPLMILDLLVIVSSVTLIITLAVNVEEEHWRYLLLLQLLRILRIDRQRGAFDTFRAVIRNHFKELLTCWYMGFTVIIFLSYLIYADPTVGSKRTVNDLVNGLYWGVVSMTTIGYGDISPGTGLAKVVLCIFALMGAGFIAMPAGIIGSGFALQVIEQAKQKNLNKRRRPAAELIQIAWKYWASDMDISSEKRFFATWKPHMNVILSHSQTLTGSSCDVHRRVNQEEDLGHIRSRQLTTSEKIAVGFIRRLKYNVAVRNFKQATRPYDVKDILDKFAASHTEIFDRLKGIRRKVDTMSEKQEQTDIMNVSLQYKMDRLEAKVTEMSQQMTDIRLLLENLSRNGGM